MYSRHERRDPLLQWHTPREVYGEPRAGLGIAFAEKISPRRRPQTGAGVQRGSRGHAQIAPSQEGDTTRSQSPIRRVTIARGLAPCRGVVEQTHVSEDIAQGELRARDARVTVGPAWMPSRRRRRARPSRRDGGSGAAAGGSTLGPEPSLARHRHRSLSKVGWDRRPSLHVVGVPQPSAAQALAYSRSSPTLRSSMAMACLLGAASNGIAALRRYRSYASALVGRADPCRTRETRQGEAGDSAGLARRSAPASR